MNITDMRKEITIVTRTTQTLNDESNDNKWRK